MTTTLAHTLVTTNSRRDSVVYQHCPTEPVRDHLLLRTEPTTNDVTDYGLGKAVEKLPQLRQKMRAITTRYLDVQQDILETFLDRGQGGRQTGSCSATP